MNLTIPGVVAICAVAGFLIVWLVFPTKRAADSVDSERSASNSPPPQNDQESQFESNRHRESEPINSSSRPRWCDILLVEPDASPASIRKAYARLMKGLHPDLAGPDANTSRQCALVQEAYQQALQERGARK
jgi:hypothetical protein